MYHTVPRLAPFYEFSPFISRHHSCDLGWASAPYVFSLLGFANAAIPPFQVDSVRGGQSVVFQHPRDIPRDRVHDISVRDFSSISLRAHVQKVFRIWCLTYLGRERRFLEGMVLPQVRPSVSVYEILIFIKSNTSRTITGYSDQNNGPISPGEKTIHETGSHSFLSKDMPCHQNPKRTGYGLS